MNSVRYWVHTVSREKGIVSSVGCTSLEAALEYIEKSPIYFSYRKEYYHRIEEVR